MKLRLFILLSLIVHSSIMPISWQDEEPALVVQAKEQTRFQQLKRVVANEIEQLRSCLRADENCDQKRKRVYQAIGLLIATAGVATAAGLIARRYMRAPVSSIDQDNQGQDKPAQQQPTVAQPPASSVQSQSNYSGLQDQGSVQQSITGPNYPLATDQAGSVPQVSAPGSIYDDYWKAD